MSREYRISGIAPNTPAGEELIKACQLLVEQANEELKRSNATVSFRINGIYGDPPACEPKSIEDGCDIGIAYGDSLSSWVNENISRKSFLLMSAAEIEGMNDIHLKAYPSATTMGRHLAELTRRCIKKYKKNPCALFENSKAGSLCCESFLSSAGDFAVRQKNVFTYEKDNENFGDYVASLINTGFRVFCVYGFETSGKGYKSLLNSLVEWREKDKTIKILTDVNLPDKILIPDKILNGAECVDALVCGSSGSSNRYCVGVEFFEMLMEALVELIVKSAMWSFDDGNTDICLKDEILNNFNYISTKIGTFSFVNNALCVPFYYHFLKTPLVNPEFFRSDSDSRDSIYIATARVESLTNKISKDGLAEFEETCIDAKDRFVKEILKKCFSVAKAWFIDDDFDFIDDKLKFKKSLALIKGNSIIQVPYNTKYDLSSTNVLQFYWRNDSVEREVFSVDGKVLSVDGVEQLKELNKFQIWVARDNINSVDGNCRIFSVEESARFVEEFSELKLKLNEVQNGRYLYYIPYVRTSSTRAVNNVSGIILVASVKYRDVELAALKNLVERFFGAIFAVDNQFRINRESVKSAIGSIMSRNGSHNIGSHVLAALSHNVGTMPDDRVLYQYIQHRMDYIATATTEHPRWKQPTMFVSVMLKEFLRQKHLLDYISSSEGLRAYMFQGQNIEKEQVNTIRLHIRRVNDQEEEAWEKKSYLVSDERMAYDFVRYDDEKAVDFSQDVAAAIPGGVVGQHAFYTIVENIIRNAAKHEWAEAMRIWKVANAELKTVNCRKTYPKCYPRNLDIYIDFRDNPGRQIIECRIWNNRAVPVADIVQLRFDVVNNMRTQGVTNAEKLRSIANEFLGWFRLLKKRNVVVEFQAPAFAIFHLIENSSKVKVGANPLTDAEICGLIVDGLLAKTSSDKDFLIANDSIFAFMHMAIAEENLEVATILADKIQQSFIDDLGTLRKENWGIAEMRISAGFLRCQDIAHIGGLTEADDPLRIIRPVLVENQHGDQCVGYRFNIDKPKLLLVVLHVHSDKQFNTTLEIINRNAARCGVTFICVDDLDVTKSYPYSYVLFEHLDESVGEKLRTRQFALPFRTLCATSDNNDGMRKKFIPDYSGRFFVSQDDNFKELTKSPSSADKICQYLLEEVYADWLNHVCSRGFKEADRHPDVVLDIDGNGSSRGAAQTLISQEELLKFVFENSFNAAIRSFLKENGPNSVTGSLKVPSQGGGVETCVLSMPCQVAALLYAITSMPYRQIATADDLAKVLKVDKERIICSAPNIVRAQLWLWMSVVLKNNDNVSIRYDGESVDKKWAVAFGYNPRVFVGSLESLTKDKACSYWLNRFIDYVANVVLDQADSFLRKYEERIVTLPENFNTESSGEKLSWHWEIDGRYIQSVRIISDDEGREKALVAGDICCFRHGDMKSFLISDQYYEPLSGAQSMLNAYISFQRDISIATSFASDKASVAKAKCRAASFVARLVENAATRILIIDERVMKFMREHSEVRDTIPGLRIAVADDNAPGVLSMFTSFDAESTPSFSGVKLTDFEIVIIHQGIIDKLLPGHESKKVVAAWLDGLIKKLHYVVITTGRGSPANIPNTARVLPYSVIENSILQRYPEKMILVDAVMNILPIRKKSKKRIRQ